MYKHPTYGLFWIIESVSQTTQKELEGLAGHACEGSWRVATLTDGKRVLLVTGDPSTFVTMLESGTRVDILGPSATFSEDSVRAVAEEIERAAS